MPSAIDNISGERKVATDDEIYNNYATPLIGTFLNLPEKPTVIKCPACGMKEVSQTEYERKWWASEVNRIIKCFYFAFCCCLCIKYSPQCNQMDLHHYCKNCACYFGRAMKHKVLPPHLRQR